MSIAQQAEEVRKVKRSENGVIIDPFFLTPEHTIAEADELMGRYRISGVPVVETLENRKLVGIFDKPRSSFYFRLQPTNLKPYDQ